MDRPGLGTALKKRLVLLLIVTLALPLTETAYFIGVLRSLSPSPVQPDMVLIYSGYEDRTGKNLNWAKERPEVLFLFSGWDYKRWKVEKGLGVTPARILVESNAKTTDQNARYCAPLIRERGVRRVVLALPWYHLPRALFLTRFYLMGSGVMVAPFTTTPLPLRWWENRDFHVELYKFWGSLGRIVLSWFGFERPIWHTY